MFHPLYGFRILPFCSCEPFALTDFPHFTSVRVACRILQMDVTAFFSTFVALHGVFAFLTFATLTWIFLLFQWPYSVSTLDPVIDSCTVSKKSSILQGKVCLLYHVASSKS
jgi:hypothetical protein